MNDLVRVEQHLPQTAANIRAQVNLVQEVMKAVMKEGTHYGTIPGTPKPSLWKPGAEVLAATFHIAPSYRVEDLSGPDFVRYRVTCAGTHQASGVVMGEGMGECSSLEEKYKWRKAGNREWEAAAEDRRRTKYGYSSAKREEYEIKQVRAESADQANTILKMACKRAQVAMTLNVVAASDIFTQDIEDLPPEMRPGPDEDGVIHQPIQQPQSKSAPAATGTPSPATATGGAAPDAPKGGKTLSPGQTSMIAARLRNAALTELDLEAAHPGKSTKPKEGKELFLMSEVNGVLAWIEANKKA